MADVAHSQAHLHDWIVYSETEGLFPLTGLYLVGNVEAFNRTYPKEWTRIALAHDQMEPVAFDLFQNIVVGSIGEEAAADYLNQYTAILEAPSPVDADVERIIESGSEPRPLQRYTEIEATLFVLKLARRWDAAHTDAPGGAFPDPEQDAFRQTWVGHLGRACGTLLHACELDVALRAITRLHTRIAIGPLAKSDEALPYHRAMFLASRRVAPQGYDRTLVLSQSKLDAIEEPGGVFDDGSAQEIDGVTLVLNGVAEACATYPHVDRVLRGLRDEDDDFSGLSGRMAATFGRELAIALDEALVDLLHAAKHYLTSSQTAFGETLEAQQFEWETANADRFMHECLSPAGVAAFNDMCRRLGLDRRPPLLPDALSKLPKFRERH